MLSHGTICHNYVFYMRDTLSMSGYLLVAHTNVTGKIALFNQSKAIKDLKLESVKE